MDLELLRLVRGIGGADCVMYAVRVTEAKHCGE
jgi:hypothetical protein